MPSLFLIPFFLKLIVVCRLCVICVREDNDSNVVTRLIWNLLSDVPRKAVQFSHSLTAAKYFYWHKHLLNSIELCILIRDYPALLGPLSLTQINFLVWISNHMPNKVWDKIIYPFPNFNGCTVKVWEWISNFIPQFIKDYLSLLGFKLIHVSKRVPWWYITFQCADIYYVS